MRPHAHDGSRGFSLIELLVVVGIIMVLAAMMAPPIGRYFRNYQIRGAQAEIATSIQRARGLAISKNVNHGVSFVVESETRYWVHIEDDQSAAHSRDQQLVDFAAPNPAQSSPEELPRGVRFARNAAECPNSGAIGGAAYSPNGGWFRFTRLGGRFGCPTATCTGVPATVAPPNTLLNDANGSLICVFQPATGLSRALLVSPGGRVRLTN